ncbi:class I SAM-dependent methyltransferase [Candidatus Lokiarchaeum ossiferum]|uniref:class I SAM-dependent methyltransferase n=1 Tax=Candidatus Lokiarchaeum ossiferum TaxID=2951803 RepID=UPI00352F33A3
MSKNTNLNVWEDDSVAKDYLQGTRAAIPLAQEEIRMLLKIIQFGTENVSNILDIGCGDGILGRAVLHNYPTAKLTLSDMSDVMVNAAREKVVEEKIATEVYYHTADMSSESWNIDLKAHGPYDVVVSGLAIHHLTHNRKRQIYAEIYDLLSPGGFFLNLERVKSLSPLGDKLNAENYVDSLFAYHKKSNPEVKREEIANKYFFRALKQSNILATAERQTDWLRDLGFIDVDIFFKVFEIAIFGGKKRPLDA